MSPVAYMYALPYELYEKQGVRRFGAHGTSYRFITGQVAKHYGKPAEELDLIILHLGVVLNRAHSCLTGFGVVVPCAAQHTRHAGPQAHASILMNLGTLPKVGKHATAAAHELSDRAAQQLRNDDLAISRDIFFMVTRMYDTR